MTPIRLTADRAGERLDQFLARSVEGLTRSAAQRLLEEGAVTLGGLPVKKNYKTSLGDELVLALPDPAPIDVVPQDIPLDVVYEDDDVIAVNKPVGLVVHPPPVIPTALWSTHCYITAAIHSPESTGSCAPALSTGLTGTPQGSSSPPRTILPTSPWRNSSRITPCTGNTRRCAWAI